METGKTGKYLKYAIGEIILVVIGILIALQINNWNENRQKRALEREYLSEIKGNLVKDTLSINTILDFYTQKADTILSTFALFEKANQGQPYMADLKPKIGILTDHKIFMPIRTGFDNMVSSEKIGLITHKTLRNLLSNYYSDLSYRDGTQQRVKTVTREFADDLIPKLMSKELMYSFFNINLDLKSDSTLQIHSNEKIIANMFVMLQVSDVLISELKLRKTNVQELIHQIDDQLKLSQ